MILLTKINPVCFTLIIYSGGKNNRNFYNSNRKALTFISIKSSPEYIYSIKLLE